MKRPSDHLQAAPPLIAALAACLALGCAPGKHSGARTEKPIPPAPPSPISTFEPDRAPAAVSEAPTGTFVVDEDLMAEYALDEAPSTDTLRLWNKAMFHFNDRLFFWVVKPASKGYGWLLPRRARLGVRNAIDNIQFPRRFLNCGLQGRFDGAGVELARFLTNSTVGLAGTWDPAREWMNLQPERRDFDQTLGKWGAGTGTFITWPFLGPSSVRGTFGAAGDWATSPFTLLDWAGADIAFWVSPAVTMTNQVNDASLGKTPYETILEIAVDPYTAVRDAYLQNRAKKIAE